MDPDNAGGSTGGGARSQWNWMARVLRGHYAYYGLPSNFPSLQVYSVEVRRLWYRSLRRGDRKHAMTWDRFNVLLERFPLPRPRITHPRMACVC